jgi:hypothetical protein
MTIIVIACRACGVLDAEKRAVSTRIAAVETTLLNREGDAPPVPVAVNCGAKPSPPRGQEAGVAA